MNLFSASIYYCSTMTNDHIFSVSDITRAIQQTLESSFSTVTLRGEISNYIHHSSGHRYFSLKDGGAQLKAVMWRSTPLRFTPANGMSVIAKGKITMYAPQGAVQLECRAMEPLGAGDLQLAFEALKRDLYERGWFDEAYKKPLPRYPLKIGVATSPTGAAVRDILTTLARRMPAAQVLVRPTLVQGDGAAEDIARAIQELNSTDCEVLIVGRGGGSIEDLWAFNTEIVAEAIFRSEIPIISAVGHEIDVTIADFVADVRAATPTAAAELAVRDQNEIWSALQGTQAFFDRAVEQRMQLLAHHMEFLGKKSALARFPDLLRHKQQRIDELQIRINAALPRTLAQRKKHLEGLGQHLASLHPYAPLQKGFALLEREGRIVSASEALKTGEEIAIIRGNERRSALVR
ncbi:MAG: exodeoxyribonuclease VII large subunit [Candidatus Kapabacteria bacterium]|nr:exodeoxyribonuclease VII large subunit [Candidatus Kapabacteria bacterium]